LNAAGTLRDFKEAAERAFLVAKLRENDWNIAAAALSIGTPRSNLYKKLGQQATATLPLPRPLLGFFPLSRPFERRCASMLCDGSTGPR
jgi:hypothetical protein